jgi:hypothetical protein
LEHAEIHKLWSPTQYVKNYKSELYVPLNAPKARSKTHKADAMRLSPNLAFSCAQNTPDTEGCNFEKFQTAGRASFEHNRINYEFWGYW